uniref:START domain-containing protein n=1 Tax=Nelumbo nucifera TaxID=4432 RepID=A0A822YTZ0_NELNU|nr:TPA_asm: hypothetical protein HUJ06_006752 [Nelumbo nucifera]
MAVVSALFEILERPNIGDIFMELMGFFGPLWIAVLVGIVVGWSWKPKWASLGRDKLDSSISNPPSLLPSSSSPRLSSLKATNPSCNSLIPDDGLEKETFSSPPTTDSVCGSSQLEMEKSVAMTEEDLEFLCQLAEMKDGGPAWMHMMDRSTPNMSYQAWQRDPENGPPQYRFRTVYEDATPEMVRDFYWDDDFRSKWDDMLKYSATLEQCPTTGTMVVHWIRKGVPCPSVPRRNKPRRVDLYYSSWIIRAVESKRGDGQLTACEVLLFHHEDMGIPWEVAKLGVRHGMWGAVKKIDPGLRAYQKNRAAGSPLSHGALMAQINTKINVDYFRSLETTGDSTEVKTIDSSEKPLGRNIPKLLVVGGAVLVAFTLDRGLLTKAVIFGVARRFANIGRRL